MSTASAKIGILYEFGLLPRDSFQDLNHLRKIRNDFAHEPEPNLTFDSPKVSKHVDELKTVAGAITRLSLITPESSFRRWMLDKATESRKDKFIVTVTELVNQLEFLRLTTRKNKIRPLDVP